MKTGPSSSAVKVESVYTHLRDMEMPMVQLNGLVAALRMVHRHPPELEGEDREAVEALLIEIENVINDVQECYDGAYALVRVKTAA